MQRLSNKQKWLNTIQLTRTDDLFIGIDTHKRSFHVALWLNDAPAIDFVTPSHIDKLIATFKKLRPAIRRIVYEAGPTGYSLARQLQAADFPVNIAAPSKTPRPAARDDKTDRLDAKKLAEFAAKGLLRYIAIPTKEQEAQRQLTRLREQLVDKQKRTKLQIKSFLLQHGIDVQFSKWSKAAIGRLRDLKLSRNLSYCLNTLIDQLLFTTDQIKDAEKQISEMFAKGTLARRKSIFMTHPGVGEVIATQFATEIFSPRRFTDKTHIAKYVGLAPTVHQSGQTLRDGPISRTGRPQLRCNLIQGAWAWVFKDPAAAKTFYRLQKATGETNKAITAMARKLAVHLWKMACDSKPYIANA
jgi:transposase